MSMRWFGFARLGPICVAALLAAGCDDSEGPDGPTQMDAGLLDAGPRDGSAMDAAADGSSLDASASCYSPLQRSVRGWLASLRVHAYVRDQLLYQRHRRPMRRHAEKMDVWPRWSLLPAERSRAGGQLSAARRRADRARHDVSERLRDALWVLPRVRRCRGR
jgi:hypothetical protein